METIQAIAKWLADEGRVIAADAPFAFLASVALIGLLLYFLIKAFFNERIEVLEQRLKRSQDITDEYKNRLQGATPEEAARAIQALQKRVMALEPRRLSDEQRQLLREALGRSRDAHLIEIAYDGACADARGYQADLAHVFGEMGWQVSTPMVLGPGVQPPSGLAITLPTDNPLPLEANLVTQAMRTARIPFDSYRNRPRGIRVIITSPIRR